jgi:hypothetical protein
MVGGISTTDHTMGEILLQLNQQELTYDKTNTGPQNKHKLGTMFVLCIIKKHGQNQMCRMQCGVYTCFREYHT